MQHMVVLVLGFEAHSPLILMVAPSICLLAPAVHIAFVFICSDDFLENRNVGGLGCFSNSVA